MEGTVIPLPSAYAGLPAGVRGHRDHVAVATIEFVPAGEYQGAPPEEILDRVHERCVRAALVMLGRHGIVPVLAGTTAHPVVEATFDGEDAEGRAAAASIAVIEAVRDTQRVEERFLAACAGLAGGTVVRTDGTTMPGGKGVQVTTGSPGAVAELLRARAGADEILVAGERWSDLADDMGADQLPDLPVDDTMAVPVWRVGTGPDERAER